MSTITTALTTDHRDCDERLCAVEGAVDEGSWSTAAARFEAFALALRRHLDFEEHVLFAALEEAPGFPPGPIEVMRADHDELRAGLEDLERVLEERDAEAFTSQAETLLILLQQHNMKEEQVLYGLADEMLEPERRERVLAELAAWETGA